MGTGSRGARGHGWLHKYRAGLGGRHLQGTYHNRNTDQLVALNHQVFALNNNNNNTPNTAYLEFTMEGETKRTRITLELARVALPHACNRFQELCHGDTPSNVFKIVQGSGVCLGPTTSDTTSDTNDSSTNESSPLPSSRHVTDAYPNVLSHAQKGMVSLLSSSLNNETQLLITTVDDAPHLDGRLVPFARVTEGLEELVSLADTVFTKRGKPNMDIQVTCGLLE